MKKLLQLFFLGVVAGGLAVEIQAMEAMHVDEESEVSPTKRCLKDPEAAINAILQDNTEEREGETYYNGQRIVKEIDDYLGGVQAKETREQRKTYDYSYLPKYDVGRYGLRMLAVLADVATCGDSENEMAKVVREHLKTRWNLSERLDQTEKRQSSFRRECFRDEEAWKLYVKKYEGAAQRKKEEREQLLFGEWASNNELIQQCSLS